jgi:protein-arginine kinase activator protein McsA
MPSDEELQGEGWKLASITGGEHLRKTLAMYHELGIETHLEEIDPKDCGGCTECYQSDNENICRIYTRIDEGRRSGAKREETA